jgi:hypothetical protein
VAALLWRFWTKLKIFHFKFLFYFGVVITPPLFSFFFSFTLSFLSHYHETRGFCSFFLFLFLIKEGEKTLNSPRHDPGPGNPTPGP